MKIWMIKFGSVALWLFGLGFSYVGIKYIYSGFIGASQNLIIGGLLYLSAGIMFLFFAMVSVRYLIHKKSDREKVLSKLKLRNPGHE